MRRIYLRFLIGLPRSGKSTFARKFSSSGINEIIINTDSVRLAIHGQRWWGPAEPLVWATAYNMIRALVLAGHDHFIIDNTNITAAERDKWIDVILDVVPKTETVIYSYYYFVDTPVSVCIERAKATGQEDIIPTIEKMNERLEVPAEASLIYIPDHPDSNIK